MKTDRDALGITIERCFTQRRLYTEPLKKEDLDFVCKSAAEVRDELRKRADDLSGRGGDHPYSLNLILEWETAANRLLQVMRDRKSALGESTWVENDAESSKALVRFRGEALPVIGILIVQLEGHIKTRAEETFIKATMSASDVAAIEGAISAA